LSSHSAASRSCLPGATCACYYGAHGTRRS